MDTQQLIQELCKMELKQIRHCMKQGKLCGIKSCLDRLQLYKSVDLNGGATFWQEFQQETKKSIEEATEEELVLYLQNHEPTQAQFNGAVNELTRYLLKKSSSSVQEARNKAFLLLGKDAEFIAKFLQEANQRQQALLQLVENVPSNVVSSTTSMINSNVSLLVPSMTMETSSLESLSLSAEEKQLVLGTTVGLFSILFSDSDIQTKILALEVILLFFYILEKKYNQAEKLRQKING